MAGKSKSSKSKGKSKSSGKSADTDGNPFKCLLCGRTFVDHKSAVTHSDSHRGKKWVCGKEDCARVVNLYEIGHVHLKVSIAVPDVPAVAVVDHYGAKLKGKQGMNRY